MSDPRNCPACQSPLVSDDMWMFECESAFPDEGRFVQSYGCRVTELENRLASAEKDAARWRFIRDNAQKSVHGVWFLPPIVGGLAKTFDAAIDSMMADSLAKRAD